MGPVRDGTVGYLFEVLRARRSFAREGQAQWLHSDSERIVLGDVVPEQGQVLLSLHYQEGIAPRPAACRSNACRMPSTRFRSVRLRLSGPAARVTITWDHR